MATSTCPKCSSHTFELKEHEPNGSRFKLLFIQCASCGAVAGVTDFHNVPVILEKIGAKLGIRIFE